MTFHMSSSHPTAQAFRFPCSACAAVGCALPCCIRLPKTFVALQCVRCCGLRIVFVASDRPSILFPLRRVRRCGLRVVFVASDNPSISFPLQCVRRCGLRIAVLHPTDCPRPSLLCNAWFFFYRLTCSYRFMFFLIDWKLPPPACPGTTGRNRNVECPVFWCAFAKGIYLRMRSSLPWEVNVKVGIECNIPCGNYSDPGRG